MKTVSTKNTKDKSIQNFKNQAVKNLKAIKGGDYVPWFGKKRVEARLIDETILS